MHIFRSRLLDAAPGVSAVFLGRGEPARPDPSSLLHHLGVACSRVVTAAQIHSGRWLLVGPGTAQDAPGTAGEGDALLTGSAGTALGIRTADCLPIAAIDPAARALAVVHAGWRGTVAGVLENALSAMTRNLGARPERILVAIGPGARRCCYEVGGEVVEAFSRARPAGAPRVLDASGPRRARLDLAEANRQQALAAGVQPESIEDLGICSICRVVLCHSHRRDGERAGRMWLLAALTRGPASLPSS